MKLFSDHARPTLRTNTINATLTCYMRFLVPALQVRTNTITVWTRAGFVAAASPAALPAAALPAAALPAATLAASTTKVSVYHPLPP
jgi:hypothetical protein